MKYYVYIHRTPSNKTYVGITKMNPEKRWKRGLGYRGNKHFYNAILKYGWDNISHEVIEVYTEEWMYELEKDLIFMLKSADSNFGYNKSIGGESIRLKYETDGERNDASRKYNKRYYQHHKEERKRYNQQHKEEIKQHMQQYRRRYNQEHKEDIIRYNQRYNQEHEGKKKQYNQQYYQEHEEQRKQYGREWYKKNKKTNK
jgi:hypothetical protein